MPAIHYYTVARTQEVRVSSTSPEDALTVATAYFNHKAIGTEVGAVTRGLETTNVTIDLES